MSNEHLIWRLRNNDTARDLCRIAADEIERLNALLKMQAEPYFPGVHDPKCGVCGIDLRNAMAYACSNPKCPMGVSIS